MNIQESHCERGECEILYLTKYKKNSLEKERKEGMKGELYAKDKKETHENDRQGN